MAAGGLNFLQLIAPKARAVQPTATAAVQADPVRKESSRDFARLVKESTRNDPEPRVAAKAAKPAERSAQAATEPLEYEIAPEEAEAILQLIKQALPEAAKPGQSALCAEIEEIVATGVAKSVGEILAVAAASGQPMDMTLLEAVQPMLVPVLAEAPVAALIAEVSVAPSIAEVAVEKPLIAPQPALLLSAPREAETEMSINPLLVALQDIVATLPPAEVVPKEESAELKVDATVTEITPLAQSTVIPLTMAVPVAPVAVQDAETTDIEARIPALNVARSEVLPQVTLPGASDAKPASQPDTSGIDFDTTMQNLLSTRPEGKATTVAEPEVGGPKKTEGKAAAAVDAMNAATGAGAAFAPRATVPVAPVVGPSSLNSAPVVEQVQVAVRQAIGDGISRMTIQLSPEDLGRVEVNIRTERDGRTHVSFLIDKPETFDGLSRDARVLERALQDSGVKADTGGMQFNLRQQQPDTGEQGQPHSRGDSEKTGEEASAKIATPAPVARHYRVDVRDGIDIHA